MKKSLILCMLLLSSLFYTGCAVEVDDANVRTVQQRLVSTSAAQHDLAALAHKVIDCRGRVTGDDFMVSGGMIVPQFVSVDFNTGYVQFNNNGVVFSPDYGVFIEKQPGMHQGALSACPNASNSTDALYKITALVNAVAVQKLSAQVSAVFVSEWSKAVSVPGCPMWNDEGFHSGDPTDPANLLAGFDKTERKFSIPFGKTAKALTCSLGYGPVFIVSTSGSTIITDPKYWEDENEYSPVSPYKFYEPNYHHAMADAGDMFAERQRVGELCQPYNEPSDTTSTYLSKVYCQSSTATEPWVCQGICEK